MPHFAAVCLCVPYSELPHHVSACREAAHRCARRLLCKSSHGSRNSYDAGQQVAGVVGSDGNIVRLRVLELANGAEIYDDSFEVSLAVPALA